MNIYEKDFDKKGFDIKSIQSPIQVYKLAKQEQCQNIRNVYTPTSSSSNMNQIKKNQQQQLQPINIVSKEDSKGKSSSRPGSEKMQQRDHQKKKLNQIQSEEFNQINGNNPYQQNQMQGQYQMDYSQNTQNYQKRYSYGNNRNLNHQGSSPSNGFNLKQKNSNEQISPTSFQQSNSKRNSINSNDKSQKNQFTKEDMQFDGKGYRNENEYKNILNLNSPQIRIKKYVMDNNQRMQQTGGIKSPSNYNSSNNNQTNSGGYSSDEDKNQEYEQSLNKFNESSQKKNSQHNGVEKILHQITSGEKLPSKLEISRPPSSRNQNFRITRPKNVSMHYNEENNQIGYVSNGQNNISRLQSKETSDTPQNQTCEKSQESSTEIQHNKYKNYRTNSNNQLTPSLQALEEEVQINILKQEQKQTSMSETKNNKRIQSLENIVEQKQSLKNEVENSPTNGYQDSQKINSKSTISEYQNRQTKQDSFMMSGQGLNQNKEDKSQLFGQRQFDNNEFLDAQVGELLGQGAYGKVYKGFIKSRGTFIAIKEMKEESIVGFDTNSLLESISKEIQLLKQLSHKNIVNYIGSKKQEGCIYIYMEYMSGGSISEMLKKYGGFDEEVLQKFVKQLLEGLIYLHSKGVIHRDLKGANILSDGCGNVKLADFGAARNIENRLQYSLSQSEFCNSIKGSLYWMAPELIKNEKHGRRIDVWSLGCTVIEMASGQHPWENVKKFSELANAVIEEQPIPIPQHLSQECKDFIQLCCTYDKKIRPKSYQLQNHPFLLKSYN